MTEGVDLGFEGLSDFRVIGAGGFATVYAAHDHGFDRWVAVKVLHSIDDAGRRRFDRERALMGRLDDHPNVITPYRFGQTDTGSPYLVMEYAAGGSLDDRLESAGLPPTRTAVEMILPIASALGYAHGHGILHRDVKPANILITANGTPKLTDFGIAGLRQATASGVAYTVAHASPETFADGLDKRDERSDLYSLASTLFTLLTGSPPYQLDGHDSPAAYMLRIMKDPIPAIGEPGIDAFFARALAKEPTHRPATAAAFIAALRSAVHAAPDEDGLAVTEPDTGLEVPSGPGATAGSVGIPVSAAVRGVDDIETQRTAVLAETSIEHTGRRADAVGGRRLGRLVALGVVAVLAAGAALGIWLLSQRGGDTEVAADDGTREPPRVAVMIEEDDDTSTTAASPVVETESVLAFTGHANDGNDPEVDDVKAVAVLSDGRVISGSDDGTARVWDLAGATGETSEATFVYRGHEGGINAVVELGDGRIATGSFDGTVRVWNETDGESIAIFTGHADDATDDGQDNVRAIAVLPDGRIASGSADGTVRVWSVDDPSGAIVFEGHREGVVDQTQDDVRSLAVMADGRVVSGGRDGTVQVWDPASPDASPIVYRGHGGESSDDDLDDVWAVAALPDGRVASGGADALVRVWDPADPEGSVVSYDGHTEAVRAIVALGDGRIASAGNDGTVHIWGFDADGTPTAAGFRYEGHEADIRGLAVLPDGRVASGSEDGTVHVWAPPE